MSEHKKFCITCKEEGHTYLECPELNFFDLFGASMGLPSIATGESATELQQRVISDIEKLEDRSMELDPGDRRDAFRND